MKIKVTLFQHYNEIEMFYEIADEELALTIIAEVTKHNPKVKATFEYVAVQEEAND